MTKKIIAIGIILMAGNYSNAQNKFQATVHLAPPLGNFKQSSYDAYSNTNSLGSSVYGHASTGIGFGLSYLQRSGEGGLHLAFGIDVYRHGINSSIKSQFDADKLNNAQDSRSFSSYLNIPLSVGLHYEKDLKEGLALFGQFAPLLDIFKITKGSYYDQQGISYKSYTHTYKVSTAFGFGLQAGLVLKDKFSFALGYKLLGGHQIEQTSTYESSNSNEITVLLIGKRLNTLNLSVGIRL